MYQYAAIILPEFPSGGLDAIAAMIRELCHRVRDSHWIDWWDDPDFIWSGTLSDALNNKSIQCARVLSSADGQKIDHMLATELWNGLQFQRTDFDGDLNPILEILLRTGRLGRCEYQSTYKDVSENWCVILVEYHH